MVTAFNANCNLIGIKSLRQCASSAKFYQLHRPLILNPIEILPQNFEEYCVVLSRVGEEGHGRPQLHVIGRAENFMSGFAVD